MNFISISTSSPRSGSDFNFSSACEVLSFDASRTLYAWWILRMRSLLKPRRSSPICVQSVGTSIARGRGLGKGKNITGNGRAAADKRVRANADEVMYRDRARPPRPTLRR